MRDYDRYTPKERADRAALIPVSAEDMYPEPKTPADHLARYEWRIATAKRWRSVGIIDEEALERIKAKALADIQAPMSELQQTETSQGCAEEAKHS